MSPSPDSPEMVSGLAPIFSASQRISLQPCQQVEPCQITSGGMSRVCGRAKEGMSHRRFHRCEESLHREAHFLSYRGHAVKELHKSQASQLYSLQHCRRNMLSSTHSLAISDWTLAGHAWAMRAAMALLPSCRPSTMPAAMASTFFKAPQISTPTTSVVVFTRSVELANKPCIALANPLSCAARPSMSR